MSAASTSAINESFTASDGYCCHYRRYEPAVPPRAIVVCVHGIQSHGGWYDYSCKKLCAAGYRVLYPDRRGSGLNPRARGDAPSFSRLLDDLVEFLGIPAVVGPNGQSIAPVYLAAVSWGGKLALGLQRWQPGLVQGQILLCPGFFPQVGVPLVKRLPILGARLVTPQHHFLIPLNDPELFTASPKWREFIRTDPLALREATARFLVESVLLDRYLRWAPQHVTVPTLLLLAGQDRIIRNDKTHRFFQKFATSHKNVITYAEAHHTLEFEPEPDRFITEIIRWLDRQTGQGR